MVMVIKREPAHFRIQIYDMIAKKTKTISIGDHKEISLEKLKSMIVNCLEKV